MRALLVFLLLTTTSIAAINEVDGSTTTQAPAAGVEVLLKFFPKGLKDPNQEQSYFWDLIPKECPMRAIMSREANIMLFWFGFVLAIAGTINYIYVKRNEIFQEIQFLRQQYSEIRDRSMQVAVVNQHSRGSSRREVR